MNRKQIRSYFVLGALVASIAFAVLTRGGYMREFWLPIALLIFITAAYFFITRKEKLHIRSVWKVDILLLVFLGWAILTYFTSVNRERTIYELVRLLALVSVFLLASYGLQGEKLKRTFLFCVLIIGVLEALYGLLSFVSGEQLLGFYWLQDITMGRLKGTFLNANHFAGYMEMATLAGFGLAAGVSVSAPRERLAKRIIIIMACSITLVGLVLSLSRGSWISFLFGCALLVPLYSWKKRLPFARAALFILLLLLIAGAYVAGSEMEILEKRVKNMTRIYEEGQSSQVSRMSIWKSSVDMIKDDPVMGKGWGTYERAFPAYRKADSIQTARFAHNDYLQIASEAGIPGLLLFLAFLFMIFKKGIESLSKGGGGPMQRTLPGVLAAWGAILAHGLVDFNLMIPSSSITFFALAGIVSGHARETLYPQEEEGEDASKQKGEKLLVGLLLAAFAFRILQMWTAQIYYQKGEDLKKQENYYSAAIMYEKSINLLPRRAEYHHALGSVLFDMYLQDKTSVEPLKKAFGHYDIATELDPLYPYHWFEAAMVLQVLEEKDVNGVPSPRQYLSESLEIDPHHPRFLSGLVYLQIKNNSLMEARETFYRLFLVYPTSTKVFADALFPNKTELEAFGKKLAKNPEASLNFAEFLYQRGHKNLAEKQIQEIPESKLIELEPVLSAKIFDKAGKTEKAKRILFRAWNESEDHSNFWVGRLLARHYEKSGETKKAFQVWRILIKQYPETPYRNLKFARLANKIEKNDLALQHYKKVIGSEPSKQAIKKAAYLGIAEIMQQKGMPEEALSAYHKALKLDPDNRDLKVKILKLEMKR